MKEDGYVDNFKITPKVVNYPLECISVNFVGESERKLQSFKYI